MFENRAFRKIFWTKRQEVTWKWNQLHGEELHNVQKLLLTTNYAGNLSKGDEMGGHVARTEKSK